MIKEISENDIAECVDVIRRSFCTVAEELGFTIDIIGYYSLELQDNNQCELNNLCVLPLYRHKHIGKNLLEDACIKAKKAGCKKMNIGIVEENGVLKKWYVENDL